MAKANATIPQGTRDFGPEVVHKRNYIFSTIKNVFEKFGYQPLETPAFENLETLMGKYGEEGDRLIFKILNNGLDNPAKETSIKEGFEKILSGKNTATITERALRYDLTIPFARYVAMNHGQLSFPYKRYQMQPVWRADRPQKGRYREFYQCDADVVGSASLWNEVELCLAYAEVFETLGIPVEIKLNSRKILAALAEIAGGKEKLTDITVAIDKIDKIGIDKVKEELSSKGLTTLQIETIASYLQISGSNESVINNLKNIFTNQEEGLNGIAEVEFISTTFQNTAQKFAKAKLVIDPSLARGLNYYTGAIFEVKARGVAMGSIGGGGRYDDLTGLFGVPDIPGVGISFGVDRIYDVLEELKLFPDTLAAGPTVLFFNLGEKEAQKAFELLQNLRASGIKGELYHEATKKLDKQFKYAEKKHIKFVAIIGDQELATGTCKLKNISTGEQEMVPFHELQNKF